MKLELNGLSVECIIGDLPEERVRTQRLRVDVSLEVGGAAATSDELSDTVDYAALASRIREGLIAARCKMIERAAKVAHDVCMEDSRVTRAEVKVTKFGAIPFLESAAAVWSTPTTRH